MSKYLIKNEKEKAALSHKLEMSWIIKQKHTTQIRLFSQIHLNWPAESFRSEELSIVVGESNNPL